MRDIFVDEKQSYQPNSCLPEEWRQYPAPGLRCGSCRFPAFLASPRLPVSGVSNTADGKCSDDC